MGQLVQHTTNLTSANNRGRKNTYSQDQQCSCVGLVYMLLGPCLLTLAKFRENINLLIHHTLQECIKDYVKVKHSLQAFLDFPDCGCCCLVEQLLTLIDKI